MSFETVVLILAQLATQPVCGYQEQSAPEASLAVKEILTVERATRPQAERALKLAISSRDSVGEAQAEFNLARITFEATREWPADSLDRATAACEKGGCGPEMIGGFFQWAYAMGPSSPTFKQAIDKAFSIAEHEKLRPLAAAEQLFSAASTLTYRYQLSTIALRSRNLAQQILEQESARGTTWKNPARAASAESLLADSLASANDYKGAASAYSKAATIWSRAGCRSENIQALMDWASTLHSSESKKEQMNNVLARVLSAAETNQSRDASNILPYYGYESVWKDASLTNRKRYLAFRKAQIKNAGDSSELGESELAQQAEELRDWNLAFELYSQLLKSATDYDKIEYLGSLARVTDKQGKPNQAAKYRQRAKELSEKQQRRYSGASKSMPASPAPASRAGPRPAASPWSPPRRPEQPGSEGGTPGAKQDQPKKPGTEGGTPGEKPDHPQ